MANVGRLLMGRYRLDALLGNGATSTVFRAWDTRLRRHVAVKLLAASLAADPDVARRFEAEARHLGAVTHPNLVTVFDVGDVGDEGGEPFYVMELVEGGTLEMRLLRLGTLSPTETAAIVGQVAKALELLHARGLVHGDVKPGNVLLSDGGTAQLADFGLVSEDRTGETTVPGVVAGTLGYLAPEVTRGEPATAASDVYALGAFAYRALTGSLPYPAATIAELVEAQAVPARPVSALRTGVGAGVDAAIARALGPAAARPTAGELAAHLNVAALAHAQPISATAPAALAQASVPLALSARAFAAEPTRTMRTVPGVPGTWRNARGQGWLRRSPGVLVVGLAVFLLAALVLGAFSAHGFLVPPLPSASTAPGLVALEPPIDPGASPVPHPSPPPTIPPTAIPTPAVNLGPTVQPPPAPRQARGDRGQDGHGHGDGHGSNGPGG